MEKPSRILIVDDMHTMRKTLRHALERLGYSIAGEAADGTEALNMLRHAAVDVVLSDWNIQIVAEALKPDYIVRAAINGRAALKAAQAETPPDLILLDIMMPQMDGMAVLKALKADPRTTDIPVIFVTALGQSENIAAGLDAGAADYVVKPVQPLVLRARIATQLRLKDATDTLREQLDLTIEHVRLQEDIDRMVRHDIRNPLTAIIGYTEELNDLAYLSSAQRELVDKIEQATYTVSELVNFSVELLRIERGDYQPKLAAVDLVGLSRRVARDLQPLARNKGVEVVLQDQSQQVVIKAEHLLAYSVLANLIRNAIEAAPTKSSVLVRFGHEDQQGLVSIINKGEVPAAIRPRLFEKGVTFGKEGGSGLGTYCAKLMTEVQGGHLSFVSNAEDGTMFTLKLPATTKTATWA